MLWYTSQSLCELPEVLIAITVSIYVALVYGRDSCDKREDLARQVDMVLLPQEEYAPAPEPSACICLKCV